MAIILQSADDSGYERQRVMHPYIAPPREFLRAPSGLHFSKRPLPCLFERFQRAIDQRYS